MAERGQRARTSHSSGLDFYLNFPLALLPRLGPPLFVRCAPKRLSLATQKGRSTKCWVHKQTLTEGVLPDINALNSSVHSKRQTFPAEQGFGDRQRFFVLYGFK